MKLWDVGPANRQTGVLDPGTRVSDLYGGEGVVLSRAEDSRNGQVQYLVQYVKDGEERLALRRNLTPMTLEERTRCPWCGGPWVQSKSGDWKECDDFCDGYLEHDPGYAQRGDEDFDFMQAEDEIAAESRGMTIGDYEYERAQVLRPGRKGTEEAIESMLRPLRLLAEEVESGEVRSEDALNVVEAAKPERKWADVVDADYGLVLDAWEAFRASFP
jgi:hypothetical protein